MNSVQQRDPHINPIRTIDLAMTTRRDDEAQKTNLNGGNNASQTARRSYTVNDEDDIYYDGPKAWKYLLKNWTTLSETIAIFAIIILLWLCLAAIIPEYMAPHTVIMRMIFLFVGAQLCGYIVQFLRLPDMLGMIFWGVLYTNIGLGNFDGYGLLEATLREMALVNIMLLAGLGLDLESLKKVFGMVMRLTLFPTIAETGIIAVLAYFLIDMPWIWGTMLGLVITAVSPNVVVTILLKLKEERLGLNKGIHTLIIAMTSCNDVIAIFLFGVMLGIIFSTGTLKEQILQGPIGIGIGLVFGCLYGLALCVMPSNKSKYSNGLRFTMMLLGGTFSVMASKYIGYPSAGALGCITIAFVAGIGWKKRTGIEHSDVAVKMDLLWKFLKPISFSLIGKEVNFGKLDGTIVAYGMIILIIGCVFRLLFSYVSAYGGDLNWKERAYVTLSGFPKATVQAALGPVALDLARKYNSEEKIELANNILVISVLAIIFTAPLGAILMIKLAPVWLKRGGGEGGNNDCNDGGIESISIGRGRSGGCGTTTTTLPPPHIETNADID